MNIAKITVCGVASIILLGGLGTAFAKGTPSKDDTKVLQRRMLAKPNVPLNGGSCATPTAFSASPYSDSGTTAGATEIIDTIPVGCSTWDSVFGPEVVYSFVPGNAANLTFTVTPTDADYDPSIYLVSTCNDGATCVAGADNSYSGAAETFSVSTLTAGTTYYLHVDAYYPTSDSYFGYTASGPFNLNVTGTLPVELQDFKID